MKFKTLLVSAVISAKILPHTVFLNKYRKFRATYGFDGNELPVPEKIRKRFEDVMNDLKLSEEERNKIQIFSVHDINIFHAGTVLGSDAIIGIPPNYNYEDTENLSRDQVQIENKQFLLTEEISNKFLKSLVLSENAQKFAMAQAILKVKGFEFWSKKMDLVLGCIVAFIIYETLETILKSYVKSKIYTYTVISVVVFVIYFLWEMFEQVTDIASDKNISYQLAELGPKYVEGGKEYYEKLCQQNDALNHLTKVSKFSSWITRREISLFELKNFFDLKLQDMKVGKINSTPIFE